MQLAFNPADFCFAWTATWYTWDRKEAHKQARAARDAKAKELKAEGKVVTKWTNGGQIVRNGGIGSGHPEIDCCCNVYVLEVR